MASSSSTEKLELSGRNLIESTCTTFQSEHLNSCAVSIQPNLAIRVVDGVDTLLSLSIEFRELIMKTFDLGMPFSDVRSVALEQCTVHL